MIPSQWFRSAYKVADIQRFGDPRVRNTAKCSRQTIDVLRGASPVGVDVAGKASSVHRVSNQEHALDGVEARIGRADLVERVGGCCGALRIPLKDEAVVRVRGELRGEPV